VNAARAACGLARGVGRRAGGGGRRGSRCSARRVRGGQTARGAASRARGAIEALWSERCGRQDRVRKIWAQQEQRRRRATGRGKHEAQPVGADWRLGGSTTARVTSRTTAASTARARLHIPAGFKRLRRRCSMCIRRGECPVASAFGRLTMPKLGISSSFAARMTQTRPAHSGGGRASTNTTCIARRPAARSAQRCIDQQRGRATATADLLAPFLPSLNLHHHHHLHLPAHGG
jgi:hypothetical protein